jgi:membrane associated rhomboid family serine protease
MYYLQISNSLISNSGTLLLLAAIIVLSIICFNNRQLFYKLAFVPYDIQHHKQWYRLITGGFIHADYTHLLFNGLALYSFGVSGMENIINNFTGLGRFGFILFFLVATIVAHLPTFFRQKNNSAYVGIGASGATSALVFASIVIAPWQTMFFFFVPCPAIVFGVLFLALSYYFTKRGGGGNIGHEVHLYGALFGLGFMFLIKPSLLNSFINKLLNPPPISEMFNFLP